MVGRVRGVEGTRAEGGGGEGRDGVGGGGGGAQGVDSLEGEMCGNALKGKDKV